MTDDGRTPPAVADRYEDLIDRGVYSGTFVHGAPERNLVEGVLRPIVRALRGPDARILDCGCGPGAWLAEVARFADEEGSPAALFAFDLTPGMVELAGQRLAGRAVEPTIRVGDVLDPASYRFGPGDAFGLVYAFDVVQQLPKRLQFQAVETMLTAVAPGGTLVVFDHDKASSYGRKMGLKKWITRHTPVSLVPAYYTESAYPPLRGFAARLSDRPGVDVRIHSGVDTPKRAMVVRRSGAPA